jgi:putative membrane protein
MRVVLLLLSGFGLALTFEYLGSRHGFLFGDYDYTDLLGYKALGEVPVIIPIAWFMMLYPSWQLAGKITARLRGLARPAARIAIGAAAMTAWDLSLDPRWVSDGAWVWHGGGLYFGIPLSNFAGWWVTAALIFCVWTLIDRAPWRSRDAALPTAVYATTWLGESVANVLFWGGPVIGAIVFVAMGVFVNSAYGNPTRRAVSRARMRNRRLRGGLQR